MKTYLPGMIILLFVSIVLVSLPDTALAQQEPSEVHPTIVATEDGIVLPEGLVAGIVTLTFQNDTEIPFSPTLARLNDGKTLQDFMTAMQAGPAGALAVVTILGGVGALPGASLNITYDLPAGNYLFLNF